jgi:MFS family permease
MGLAVAALAFCEQVWQVFAIFVILGVGRSCLSPTSISTTLAPWFERHQGRAVSLALLGASIGGMIGTPLLLGGMAVFSSQTVFLLAGASSVIILLPVVLFVLKTRPQDIGLLPDGEAHIEGAPVKAIALWTKRGAMGTRQFRTQTAAFALALMVQSGFLSHHVPMVAPSMGAYGASLAVSLAAVAAFIGRILLARFADRVDLRLTSGGVFVLAGLALGAMSLTDTPAGLLITSVCYGLTVGNITSLSPIIARREFGAAAFGAVYGVAASAIAFASAFGPGLYGILRDIVGNYSPALFIAALLNVVAAVIIVWGGRKPMPAPV